MSETVCSDPKLAPWIAMRRLARQLKYPWAQEPDCCPCCGQPLKTDALLLISRTSFPRAPNENHKAVTE